MTQREWVNKDYYVGLGVSKSASSNGIKKACRKLARKSHPSKNLGNRVAEDKFKRVSEAYSVVGDEGKRREYDELRAALTGGLRFPSVVDADGVDAAGARGFDSDVSNLFGGGIEFGGNIGDAGGLGDSLGGFVNRNGGAGAAGRQKARHDADAGTETTLDFRKAAQGVTIPLQLTNPLPCTNYNGSGAASGTSPVTCITCHDSGYVKEQKGVFGFSSPCTDRGDRGTRIENPCLQCSGVGVTTHCRTITARVSTGVVDSQKIHSAGQGEAEPRGCPTGDLFVIVHVRPDEVFTRSGNDLKVTVPVSFGEFALGDATTAPTLGDKIRVHVPAGTADNRILRVRGRGIPKCNDTPGGLLVTVRMKMLTNLDDNAASALRSYVGTEYASGLSPREGWAGAR